MADSAIFIGWGQPVRGRELKALQVFNESMAYWGRLQQEGTIESVESFLLEPHGGDLGGFALLKGDPQKLDALRRTEEFQETTTRASLIVENLGVVNASMGQLLATAMQTYAGAVQTLA